MNFRDCFEQEIKIETDFGPIMRFSFLRTKKDIDYFVFVEGSSDENFYKHSNIAYLNGNTAYFYRTTADYHTEIKYKGKESVYYALKCISEDIRLSNTLEKCVFITDRDFEETVDEKLISKSSRAMLYMYQTAGHSVESYLFDDENLNLIFNYFTVDENDFLKKFEVFATTMQPFYALRCAITSIKKNEFGSNKDKGKRLSYKKKHGDLEHAVFCNFDFKKEDYWVGKKDVLNEIRAMEQALRGYPFAMLFVQSNEERIKQHKMYLRGHDVFEFIYQYLLQLHGVDFNLFDRFSSHSSIIREFNVNLLQQATLKS